MQPKSVTLLPNNSQEFTEPQAARWQLSPRLGSITPATGNATLYKAPWFLLLSRVVTVTALDAQEQEIDHATVTVSTAGSWMALLGVFWTVLSIVVLIGIYKLWPPPARPASVSVYPVVATLQTGDTLQFLSFATGTGDTAVTWSATEGGDITPSGVLSVIAKAAAPPITVTAARNSDHTQTASAQVIVADRRMVMGQSVVDASSMKDGDHVPFQVPDPKGPRSGLTWYLSGPGEIDQNGTYTVRDKSGSQAVVTAVDTKSSARVAAVVRFTQPGAVSDVRMLCLVVFMGAFGALLASTRSFVNFVGNRAFAPSWGFFYLFRPMFGSGLALIVFLGYRIGAVGGPQGGSPADPFTAAFVAAMVGLFADTVLQKLKELMLQLFRPQDERTDKLAGSSAVILPAITNMTVANGTLTIIGTGFAAGASVSLNGAVTPATFVDSTKLTVVLPATQQAGATIAVLVTNPDGKSSTGSVTT
jgi:hypothetical protein